MNSLFKILDQPKPFYMIFLIEFWERFGFGGMQAVLAIYMVQKIGFIEQDTDKFIGVFMGMSFGLMAIGGKLGDVFIGSKRAILIGAIILSLGYLIMGFATKEHSDILYLGLSCLAVGTGIFKANPSSLLSCCYEENDSRIDGAFTMYYMAINLGSMCSMFVVPFMSNKFSYSTGFFICSGGVFIAVLFYLIMCKSVSNIGTAGDRNPPTLLILILFIIGVIIAIFFISFLLQDLEVSKKIMYVIGFTVLFIFVREAVNLEDIASKKMWVALILLIESFVFFILYFQMPTSLNFFALYNVEHTLLGFSIAPAVFQMLNPTWIVIGSPILAYLYEFMSNTKKGDFSMPIKFAFGMSLCSIGFICVSMARYTANENGIVSSYWLIATYGFQSIGELLISGLGLAMIAKLVPRNLTGFLMGAWFISSSFAAIVAGELASSTASAELNNPHVTLEHYSKIFLIIGIVTAVIAILMFSTASYLNRFLQKHN